MQLVIHAPFGGRINRAWGMALRKRFCRSFDFELQAAATDDGIVLSLGPQHSFPLETVFSMLRAEDVEELLTQAALQAPMFETRWRWNAMRSLALLRQRGRQEGPARPAAHARPGSAGGGVPGTDRLPGQPRRRPDRGARPPAGARDGARLPGRGDGRRGPARRADAAARRARSHASARERPEPSLFSHEILNANPYAFLDDAPLEERRTRAVSMRRGLPAEVVERIGGLDPAAVDGGGRRGAARSRATPTSCTTCCWTWARCPRRWASARLGRTLFEALVADRRAARADGRAGCHWVAAERRSLAAAVWPERRFAPDVVEPPARGPRRPGPTPTARSPSSCAATLPLHGADDGRGDLAARLALPESDVEAALARLELAGAALRGQLRGRAADEATQWCDRRLLARINRRTLDGCAARSSRSARPTSSASCSAGSTCGPGRQLHGQPGLARVIAAAAGLRGGGRGLGAGDPARAGVDYDPAWLDELCLSGEVAWGRLARPPRRRHTRAARRPSRSCAAPTCPGCWRPTRESVRRRRCRPPARDVLAFLRARRRQLPRRDRRRDAPPARRGRGRAVGAGVRRAGDRRRLLGPARADLGRRSPAAARARAGTPAGTAARAAAPSARAAGRCCVRRRATGAARRQPRTAPGRRDPSRGAGAPVRQALRRRVPRPAGARDRRRRRGAIWCASTAASRCAASCAAAAWSAASSASSSRRPRRSRRCAPARREPKRGEVVRLSACDPLNLVGIITPGRAHPRHAGQHGRLRGRRAAAGGADRDACRRQPLLGRRRARRVTSRSDTTCR